MNRFQNAKRVVIKVGSSTLTHNSGHFNIRRVEQLVKVLADIQNSGKEVVLVSSGAIAVGMGKLNMRERPADMASKQAAAAVGQCELMYLYDKMFSEYNHTVSQVLMTRDVVDSVERRSRVVNTFQRLIEFGTIPIVNENDTVSVEEIEFGDNDTLSAVVAKVVHADALVILTDIDGLHARNPKEQPDAPLIHVVDHITDETRRIAGGAGSSRGTGGMYTKILAAGIATAAGITTAIIDGSAPENLYELLSGGEIGTVFPGEARQ